MFGRQQWIVNEYSGLLGITYEEKEKNNQKVKKIFELLQYVYI